MPATNGGRSGAAYERLKRQVWREERVCWLCGKPVDKSLPHTSRWSKSLDHVLPLHRGGAMLARSNARLAHRTCNVSRGNVTRKHGARRQSRDW